MALRADPARSCCKRPGDRQAHRADRARRGAHVRHGVALPPARHLRHARASSTSRSTRRRCCYYKEAKDGQILEEGITEAGSMASFIAAGTAYATPRPRHDPVLHLLLDVRLPAHRRPDLGVRRPARPRLPARRDRRPHDAERRGAAAPGRPQPACSPRRCRTCVAYDPAFAYELAVIVEDGLRRMYEEREDIFYYLTLYNENYAMPPMPEGAARRHPQGPLPLPGVASCRRSGRECSSSAAARSSARRCARSASSPSATASRPTSGARPATRSCGARRSSASAGTCCTRARSRGCPT